MCGVGQCTLQVLRSSRYRVGAAGTAWSKDEREVIEWQHADFLADRTVAGAGEGEPLRKRMKQLDTRERVAAYDKIRCWQNGLVSSTRQGFERYAEDVALGSDAIPKLVVLSLDWHQTQWCGVWFLRNALRINLEAVPDFTHRRSRDLDLSTGECHLKLLVTRGHVCNNFMYGSFNSNNTFKDLQDAGFDISKKHARTRPIIVVALATHREVLEAANRRGLQRWATTLPRQASMHGIPEQEG